MEYILEILIIYALIVTLKYIEKTQENKINYSNYVNCLRALSDTDPELAKYLGKNTDGRINTK